MPNSHPSQTDRRLAIRALLGAGPAATQQALVESLTAQGFVATQSSVSRDLKDIGAVRTPAGYTLPDGNDEHHDEIAQVSELLRELKPAGPNLLVVRTAIGAAQRVALALDRCGWPEIVGNVGGDDTVFTATASAAAQRKVIARIERSISRD
jgi:transcriptional regulator of arginine metabolism